MFLKGLTKVAVLSSNITPEEYYDLAHEKDPYVGALLGAAGGGAAAAAKGAKGHRSGRALAGAVGGALVGGAAGHISKKVLSRYKSKKVRRMIEELNVRATPSRHHSHQD